MKRTVFHTTLALVCAAALFLPTAFASEHDTSADAAPPEEISDMTSADDWFATPEETRKMTRPLTKDDEEAAAKEAAEAAEAEKAKKEKKKEAARYTLLLSDSGYDYYLDHRATRWAQLPHGSEQILDTWVKLVPQKTEEESAQDGSYTYPQKFYLAHYYIRPKTQQIQFLSELEVTGGRPDNTVQGRGYNAQNWEDLTPDSIEDEIYHNALTQFKNRKNKKNPLHFFTDLTGEDGPKNLRDAIEEYFRISI